MTETRAQVIWRHVHAYINRTAVSWPTFATEVRARFETRQPGYTGGIEWSVHRDPHQRMRLDAQMLRRFEHDTRHGLPADLEEALVLALPEGRRDELLAELAGRYGLLAAPIPHGQHAGVGDAGHMAKEFGEAMQVLAATTAMITEVASILPDHRPEPVRVVK